MISAVPLLSALREAYPGVSLFVSCSTVAGREIAAEKLRGLADGLFYAPLDYVLFVRRVIRRVRPSLVVVMETEIWPNLWREAKRSGAALAVVNGRISDRAFPRYRRWRGVFGAVLALPDLILVQSEQDRLRYIEVGAPAGCVEAAGNLKFDFDPGDAPAPSDIVRFLEALRPAALVIAASTMPPRDAADVDEDDLVVDAWKTIAASRPDTLLLIAPRRPERFDSAAAKLSAAGVPFVRRSQLAASSAPALPCVLLLDSMGELSRLFARADVVFMGGTLPRRGGHNVLEPAYFGKPIICGPHMENFQAIADEFTQAGALVRISDAAGLAPAVLRLLEDTREREAVGSRARTLAEAKRGVTSRIRDRLMQLYWTTLPSRCRSVALAPLAAVWERESRRRQERATVDARSLDRPVISVGGITTGGAGKTPFVDWLVAHLRSRSLQPAILTRGYRRRSATSIAIVPAGGHAPASLTGDEPQIYLRHGAAHLGVGADRFACGQRLIEVIRKAGPFVLDDGFQHWRLRRDLDIVLIDALDPFGGGCVFPRGSLREPLSALGRASAFVITRVEPGFRTDPIEHEIRQWNAHAPIYRSRVVVRQWLDAGSGASAPAAPFGSAAAFCGLANPRSFWRTLENEGIDIRCTWPFDDHHRYVARELRRLREHALHMGAAALVTTEKDLPNLPPGALELVAPLPLYVVEIGIEVDGGEELVDRVMAVAESGFTP